MIPAIDPRLAQQPPAPPPGPPAKLSNGVTIQWGQPSAQAPTAPSGPAQLSNGVTIQWGQPSGGDVLSAPGDNPVSRAMSTKGAFNAAGLPYDDPTKLPKIGATGIASLPRDPMLKAKYLASKLFPDYAPDQALRHMGFDGSRYYYIAPDGKAYYAEPTFSPMSAPGLTLKELPDTVASQFGPALPTVGGIAGGIAGGPDPASVATAALGGAAGESVRQMLANGLVGESQDFWSGRVPDVLKNGAEQGLNQAIGLGIGGVAGKLVDRNPLRVAGYDASTLTPAKIAEMEAATKKGADMGVTVLPGEAGNVSSLLDNQRQLARYPESTNKLTDFYTDRNTNQIPSAYQKVLDLISPQTASSVANRDLGVAAGDVIKNSRAARSAKAGDLYTDAFAANQSIQTPELDAVLQTPAGKQAMREVATDMQNDRTLLGKSDPEMTAAKDEAVKLGLMADPQTGTGVASGLKLQTYDLIKQKLYDIEQAAKGKNGESTFSSKAIGNLRTSLTSELDRADVTAAPAPLTEADLLKKYPGVINQNRRAQLLAQQKPQAPGLYAQARKMFETDSPEVDALQKGIVGLVAKPKANALQNLPKIMLSASSSDPYSIAQAKRAFQSAGKMDAWNAGIRSFLQNTFDDAVKNGGDTGPSGALWKSIAGDNRQMANLKAALGTSQFNSLGDFMDVAKMVSRTRATGSPTATDMVSRQRLAGPLASTISKVVRGIDVFNIPNDIAAKIADVSAGKNAAQLADLITNPQAVQSLRRLKVMNPGTKQFVQEIGNLATAMGWSAGVKAIGYGQQAPQVPGTIGAATP